MHETIQQAGYEFVEYLGNGLAVFLDQSSCKKELFFANKNHAGWGLHYNNTDWEFVSECGD